MQSSPLSIPSAFSSPPDALQDGPFVRDLQVVLGDSHLETTIGELKSGFQQEHKGYGCHFLDLHASRLPPAHRLLKDV